MQYELTAFDSEQCQKIEKCYQLQIPNDLLRDELPSLTWSWQPTDLSCMLYYEYLFQGNRCQETNKFGSNDELNMQWQSFIWHKINKSPWVKFSLDAASFGRISIKLILTPQQDMSQAWWTDAEAVTKLLWLGRAIEQGTQQVHQTNTSTLQQGLQQVDQPNMPLMLRNAIKCISLRRTIPTWAYIYTPTSTPQ